MLKIPAVFFNHGEINKIGTEIVFTASLIVNNREIEKCSFFFSKSALDKFVEYLKVSLENEIKVKNVGEVKEH